MRACGGGGSRDERTGMLVISLTDHGFWSHFASLGRNTAIYFLGYCSQFQSVLKGSNKAQGTPRLLSFMSKTSTFPTNILVFL